MNVNFCQMTSSWSLDAEDGTVETGDAGAMIPLRELLGGASAGLAGKAWSGEPCKDLATWESVAPCVSCSSEGISNARWGVAWAKEAPTLGDSEWNSMVKRL